MKLWKALPLFLCLFAALLSAQGDSGASMEQVKVEVGPNLPMHRRELSPLDGTAALPHPVRIVARHPKPGCADTAVCGEIFHDEVTHNMRTSAGTTLEYNNLLGSQAAVATYIALTNTAITPAAADTTLSGEIVSNGLTRSLATPSNSSTTLTVPSAPTVTVVGTTGATSYWYWVMSCAPVGICTTVSSAGTTSTANATLSTSNYNSIAFTGQLGAVSYQLARTTSSSAPTGTVTDLVGGAPSCTTAGTVVSCTWLDISNTLTSVAIPASNLTNFGKATLVFTWTATGTQSAQAFGIFNASSSGTLFAEGTFTPVALNNADTFQLTYTLYF